jgi:arylsulfatase A-like enzyme
LIARWKGTIEPGRTSDVPCYFADVMPTLAELAGPEAQKRVPGDVDGRSLVPVLAGRSLDESDPPRFLYWELGGERRLAQAVRWGKWKAVRPRPEAALELYDLSVDEGESKDLAAEQPDVVATIEAYLKTARTAPRQQIAPTPPEGQRYR